MYNAIGNDKEFRPNKAIHATSLPAPRMMAVALPTLRVGRALRVSPRLAPPLARQSNRVEYYPPLAGPETHPHRSARRDD
jgi:hypothetical protein